jgi:hypothetical protein
VEQRIKPKEIFMIKNNICIILFVIFSLFISGCNENNQKNKNPIITKEFVIQNAKIGITEDEISDIFGKEVFRGYGDGSYVWIFDKVRNDFKYIPDLQRVAFNEIKNEKIEYQLYINVIDNKAFMYSYFYKGNNDEVWNYEIHSGSKNDSQASYTY